MGKKVKPGPSKNIFEKKKKSKNNNQIDININSCSSSNVSLITNSDFDSSSEVQSVGPKGKITKATIPLKKKMNLKVVSRKHVPLIRNFQPWEQRVMIKYLIVKKLINVARGNDAWKQMIKDGLLTHRTPFSLNNHFRKAILPNLDQFKMKRTNREKFRRLIREKDV